MPIRASDQPRIELLQRVPYFQGVPPDQLRELAERLRERHYRAGQAIFLEGDRSEGLYLVLSGRVVTFTTSAEGREQVLHAFGPGRTFGDIAVLDHGPHPGSARAAVASSVAVIPPAVLADVLARHREASLAAIRDLASRLRAFTQIVADLSLRPVTARVAHLLSDLARGRQNLVEDAATNLPRLTQREIAAMVGSVREVVQRALKTLEAAGAIELARGRVRIVDIEALASWADSAENLPPVSGEAGVAEAGSSKGPRTHTTKGPARRR